MVDSERKTILVTGASGGIGQAIVHALGRRGFRIIATARSPANLDELIAKLGSSISAIALDLSDADSIQRAAAQIADSCGERGLWGLVHNAGCVVPGPLELIAREAMLNQFNVNVIGPLELTRLLIPCLRRAKGRLVYISSVSGLISMPLIGAYCASKFAAEAAFEALRLELHSSEIGVTIVNPGNVRTSLWDKVSARVGEFAIGVGSGSPYRSSIDHAPELIRRLTSFAIQPEVVARAVVRVLVAARPARRVVVGLDARLLQRLSHLLPVWLIDRVRLRLARL